jgi:glutamate racemase
MKNQEHRHLAIGMFDSGVGGLTVFKEMKSRLPSESIIYFGDTARLPYGEKSREKIIHFSIENAIFLLKKNIKMIVVACNTASAYAINQLKNIFNTPVIGVIEPAVEKVVHFSRRQNIAILGTKGTVNSGVYQQEILHRLPHSSVTAIPCPLFVPLVEERFFHHPASRLIVQEYLLPLKHKEIDTLLLGCTHYPLLRSLIQEEIGNETVIVDSASTCAEKVAEALEALDLKNDCDRPFYQFFVSDDAKKFKSLAQEFLGESLHHVESL